MSSSAAGGVVSSLTASCAQAVAIWRNAKRAALSRLSPAHRLQFPDNLQQSSADDVITPKRAVVANARRGIIAGKGAWTILAMAKEVAATPQNQDDLSTTLRNARPLAKARQLSTMIWNRRSLR
jgi:hypothetical protein